MTANRLKFVVSGYNQARFLNKLNAGNIEVFGVKKQGKTLEFSVNGCKRNEVVAICEKSLYNVVSITEYGIASNLKDKLPIFLAVILYFAVVFVSNLFVFKTDYICEAEILGIIKETVENEISDFPLKRDINLDKIVKQLNSSKDVAYAEVSLIGNTLVVKAEKAEQRLKEEFSYRSKYSGKVTRVVTLSGTPKVKAGDEVSKGDVLIAPYVYSEKNDKTIEVTPYGAVFGEYKDTVFAQISKTALKRTSSGKAEVSRKIRIFGIELLGKNIFDGKTEVKYSETKLSNVILPITVVERTYEDVEFTVYEVDLEKEIKAQELILKGKLDEIHLGDRVLYETVNVADFGGYVMLSVERGVEKNFCGGLWKNG